MSFSRTLLPRTGEPDVLYGWSLKYFNLKSKLTRVDSTREQIKPRKVIRPRPELQVTILCVKGEIFYSDLAVSTNYDRSNPKHLPRTIHYDSGPQSIHVTPILRIVFVYAEVIS